MPSSDEVIFRQIQTRLLADALVLRHDRVIVRTGLPEAPDERHIPLDAVDPQIEFTTRRSFGGLWVILPVTGIFAAAAWRVDDPASPFRLGLALVFGGMAFGGVAAAVISCARSAVAIIRDRSGEVLFELTREQRVAADYEAFLLELQRRLKARNEGSTP